MQDPAANEVSPTLNSWRVVCVVIAWVGFCLAVVVAMLIFWEMFGASIGLALGAGGMPVEQADALKRTAAILSIGLGVVAVLAILTRRWVLLVLAMLLCGICVIFLGGEIRTRA